MSDHQQMHAGNYNRLLKINKKKAQNLHLTNPDYISWNCGIYSTFFYFIAITRRYYQDNMPEMGKPSCFSHKQILISVY